MTVFRTQLDQITQEWPEGLSSFWSDRPGSNAEGGPVADVVGKQCPGPHWNPRGLHDAGEIDTIVVFAGSTHPAPLWLDRLTPGGQLLMPLTGDNWWGFLLRATRGRDDDARRIVLPEARERNRFDAMSIGGVGIFPCAGGRDDAAAKRLDLALDTLPGSASSEDVPIEALHRGDPAPGDMDRVWYYRLGFWLERRKVGSGQ